jgi:hypothetical protein
MRVRFTKKQLGAVILSVTSIVACGEKENDDPLLTGDSTKADEVQFHQTKKSDPCLGKLYDDCIANPSCEFVPLPCPNQSLCPPGDTCECPSECQLK